VELVRSVGMASKALFHCREQPLDSLKPQEFLTGHGSRRRQRSRRRCRRCGRVRDRWCVDRIAGCGDMEVHAVVGEVEGPLSSERTG
jgi:hypothetical protein